MPPMRTVKLFRNNKSQAVRIPREFELPGTEAVMTKDGPRLIVEPVPQRSLPALLALLAAWEPIAAEFPEIDDPPPTPVEL